jgi:hypothetical protein
MLENVTLPAINFIRPLVIGSLCVIAICGGVYAIYRHYDNKTASIIDVYTKQIAAQDIVITNDKKITDALQARLASQVATIAPAKAKAQTSKAKAAETVTQIEAKAPQDAQEPIKEVVAVEDQALTDQTEVTQDTQAALDTCQETVRAEEQTIKDQGQEITTVKADLAKTDEALATETKRKERYRVVAATSTGLIVLKVIIAVVFHVPVF